MDALSEVLGHIRLKETNWACIIATSPWGLAFREAKGCVRFHYVARGNAWLSLEKTAHPRIALSGGDLAVIPQGRGHTLRDQPRSTTSKFEDLARRAATTNPSVVHLELGGAGTERT